MNLKIGIVGLPNVGKSTLFNALTKSSNAAAENFPFCTIDPNVGIVEVPDRRLKKLAELVIPEKVVPSVVEFVDIAGLVKGASEGEGLGNQFLSHIRECHAICHVLRAFEDSEIHHVEGNINPKSDLEVIMTELVLADLQSINKQIDRVSKKTRAGDKEAQIELSVLEKFKEALEQEKLVSSVELTEDEVPFAKQAQMLTAKPYLVVANVSEDQFSGFDVQGFASSVNIPATIPVVPVCAKFEADLCDMTEEEVDIFLEEIGAQRSGLESLIQKSFELLGLQSYFTAGVQEVRAWTVRQGATAPQAAGEIHTDFEKGFIKADVIAYDDYVACGTESAAKEAGKMRMEGKEYIVKDGDVMHFKFNN